MKLLHCTECRDIVRLWVGVWRSCDCGESRGLYHANGIKATVEGKAVPLGIENQQFAQALRNRPRKGMGERFAAFVIPEECNTVEVKP